MKHNEDSTGKSYQAKYVRGKIVMVEVKRHKKKTPNIKLSKFKPGKVSNKKVSKHKNKGKKRISSHRRKIHKRRR